GVTYVEAHGTGTALGDPVEINGLRGAFADLFAEMGLAAPQTPWCGLGALKATVGHMEAAAGAAGLVKTLLMLKNRRIPGNPQLQRPNPLLDLVGGPFHLVAESHDWDAPAPRRAGISSFGVGGSNAHALVEEWIAPEDAGTRAQKAGPALIILSAMDATRLREMAARLLRFLEKEQPDLADLAYTLQTGREALPHRLGFAAASLAEARTRLSAFLAGETEGLHSGFAGDAPQTPLLDGEELAAAVAGWIAKGRYDRLLEAFARGLDVDWRALDQGIARRRIGLPAYPFARERFWLDAPEASAAGHEPKIEAPIEALAEDWRETAPPQPARGPAGRIVCFLADPALRRAAMAAFGPDLVFIAPEDVAPKDVASGDIASADARAFACALERAGEAAAALYLWPLDDARFINDTGPLLRLLQAMRTRPPARLLLSGAYETVAERCRLDGWIAFERSLGLLFPQTRIGVVFTARDGFEPSLWMQTLARELGAETLASAHWRAGRRFVPVLAPIDLPAPGAVPIRQGGAYLVTGGCGGLGMIVARHLAQNYAARLLLTGRGPLDARREAQLDALRALGGDAIYAQADAVVEAQMRDALAMARARFGALDGAFHIAGVSGDAPLPDADPQGFARTLAAKVAGTEILHRLLAPEAPDFICHFSSSSALLGDFGSCDYALANRFQTAFAQQAVSGAKTIVVNWPLWRDGGRGVGGAAETAFYLQASGQRALETKEGVELFERALSSGRPQIMFKAAAAPKAEAPARPETGEAGAALETGAFEDVRALICAALKARPEEVRPARNFADLGFDSIRLADFSRTLSRRYGVEISPSVFFSHATPQRLAAHLARAYGARVSAVLDAQHARAHRAAPALQDPLAAQIAHIAHDSTAPQAVDEPIAIIGMSGRFPGARNVEELWSLLEQGIDAVTETPADRFDWREIYAPEKTPGCSVGKWLGAIPGVAEFDPLFFEISPLEAERMDPRQRHLMQESWRALESAGFGPSQIARNRIGMFVGVEEGSDYQRRLPQVSLTAAHNGVLAARLAYFLDLRGPVMAVNTACSSGLVALHLACQSLLRGECDTAIAAGVNLMVSAEAYIGMSQAGMLSADGKCRAFSDQASGMTPGEAVAAVVLRRLSRARADGDPTLAVIRASGVNYDGRTNGVTAPNGAAQTELVRETQRRAGVSCDAVEYIVAHGTATQLGDPVEVNALNDAFASATRRGYCALTSTKSNLGHTFAASGLVSLIGLVQAIRRQTIPPTLHCETENPFIDWRDSPFYVNTRRRAWPKRPGEKRLGAVSAFGMSGTNAHVIVEEAPAEPAAAPACVSCGDAPAHVLALSARTPEALAEQIDNLRAWLQSPDAANLDSVSLTLLTGRHHFEHRSAIVARDVAEALAAWSDPAALDRFDAVASRDAATDPQTAAKIDALIAALIAEVDAAGRRERMRELAALFAQGHEIPWKALFRPGTPRATLPAYPFARERHWIDPAPATPDPRAPRPAGFDGPEIARAAAARETGREVVALRNMIFGHACAGATATLRERDGARLYALTVGGRPVQYGEIDTDTPSTPASATFAQLRAGLAPRDLPAGPDGGARVGEVYASATQMLATLTLDAAPDETPETGARFEPLCLDVALGLAKTLTQGDHRPFAARRLAAFAPPPAQSLVHIVRKSASGRLARFDLRFYDANGAPWLALDDLAMTADASLFSEAFEGAADAR
ncbi:MAG: SDR family NAD(P)-dependent oxidoreductase, partial [Alphaproteobacteria bacterium]|nr:SDR family NAD(P)-dependent oxidoreductase [Alphaproteobacteria bacterium]